MGSIGCDCCEATTCEAACPVHSARSSYTANVSGLVVPFSVTLNQSTNPTQKCFFSGTNCHLTDWVVKSTHTAGSTTWPSPITWGFFPSPYLKVLSTTAESCSVGFPSSLPTQRRWQRQTIMQERYRQLQQDRYELSLNIINYGPVNQLAVAATFTVRFVNLWQSMVGLAAAWRSNNTRWDDPSFSWAVTTGADNSDNIPTPPSWPAKPYGAMLPTDAVLFPTCNWDTVPDEYATSWPQKEIGRWDRFNELLENEPCEIVDDVAVNVVEPRWETKLIDVGQFCGPGPHTYYSASYTYESDPFPCDAIPSSILLKKYPSYTDVAGYTETTTATSCGTVTRVRDFITIPKDFYVSLS